MKVVGISDFHAFLFLFGFLCKGIFFWRLLEYHKNMQKLMNLNCTVAQLILTVPHIQEFLSSVHCINMVYIK